MLCFVFVVVDLSSVCVLYLFSYASMNIGVEGIDETDEWNINDTLNFQKHILERNYAQMMSKLVS